MAEKVIIGDAELYLGDCLDVLPMLGKVDAVVTDPPYNVCLGSNHHSKRQHGYSNSTDNLDAEQYYIFLKPIIDLCVSANLALVTPGNGNERLWPKPIWTMAWLKKNGVARTPLTLGQKMNHSCWEPILVYGKLLNPPKHDIIDCSISMQTDAEGHPCPKPLRLLEWLVSLTEGTILDPFMGSGTTGVAALKLGRKFIGIEIDEGYFKIAVERISKEANQLKMF